MGRARCRFALSGNLTLQLCPSLKTIPDEFDPMDAKRFAQPGKIKKQALIKGGKWRLSIRDMGNQWRGVFDERLRNGTALAHDFVLPSTCGYV
jgi:hypothetical protein